MRAPLEVEGPGKTMRWFVPRELMVFSTDFVAPLPMATTAMTHPTPMMIPSAVGNERSFFREIAFRPTMVVLPRRLMEFFMVRFSGFDFRSSGCRFALFAQRQRFTVSPLVRALQCLVPRHAPAGRARHSGSRRRARSRRVWRVARYRIRA